MRCVVCWLCWGSLALGLLTLDAARGAQPWEIHEWGTFTSLQDEQGRSLGGINIDDEPVPSFVHNLNPYLLGQPFLSSSHWRYRMKAAPRRHPWVTMRLETPVIYFYPPPAEKLPRRLEVAVQFRGGWLTEFFPRAKADAPGLKQGVFDFGELTPDTVSSLRWSDVQVGTAPNIPQTDERVWLAPRKTAATALSVGDESEHYLFYRGVGNLEAPLKTRTQRDSQTIAVHANMAGLLGGGRTWTLPALWLVDIQPGGKSAYRALRQLTATGDPSRELARIGYRFDAQDYSTENLGRMRREMRQELVADGLFADEAQALLDTWERAYFVSPGLRLFYLVPRPWTDQVLPLEISLPSRAGDAPSTARVQRVMMGRIELISQRQRELLAQLAAEPVSDGRWIEGIPPSQAREDFFQGRINFGDLSVKIPDEYQRYLDLGRFRNALIVAQQRRTGSENLKRFIEVYALHPFLNAAQPPVDEEVTREKVSGN